LYKVKLNGNYNVYIKDLNFEFTPVKPVKTFKDEEFENSDDIKVFLNEYLTATKVGNTKKTEKVSETKELPKDVKEVPAKKTKEEDEVVINATNASKISSADKSKENKKTLVEEKQGKKDDDVVVADGASKSTPTSKETKQNDDVVVADGASKSGAKKTISNTKKQTPATKNKTTNRKSSTNKK